MHLNDDIKTRLSALLRTAINKESKFFSVSPSHTKDAQLSTLLYLYRYKLLYIYMNKYINLVSPIWKRNWMLIS